MTSERSAGATTRYRMAFPADFSRPQTDEPHTAKSEEIQGEADADPSHRCDTPTRRTDETLPVASMRPLPSHSCDPTRRTDATQIPGNENREENPGNLKPSERSASPHADAREGKTAPADQKNSWQVSPGHSGKIAEAESSQGAFREAETKAGAKATKVAPAGMIARSPRKPVQVDMLAEDAKRIEREAMIAFRKAYPASSNTPINDAGWRKISPFMRKGLAIAPAAEIIAGTERYAATCPTLVYGPKRFLEKEMFRRPWALKPTPQANGFDRATATQAQNNAVTAGLWAEMSGEEDQ